MSTRPTVASTLAFGGLVVSEWAFRPGTRQRAHEHERASVYMYVAGSCAERYGAREREYREASVVTSPAGARHAVRYGSAGGRIVNVEIGDAHLERLRVRAPLLDRIEELRGGRAERLMRQIHAELLRPELASGLAIEGLVGELTAMLARDERERDTAPRWIRRAREILHDSSGAPVSLSGLAASVGIHPTHLARAFRRHHGCTVGEFVRRIRVRDACDRLITSDASVADIAMSTGFADQSHLGRTFKRMLGVTPAAFRETRRSRRR